MYGLVGQYERVAYCGAKAGTIGMVRAMALDIADGRTNVRVGGMLTTVSVTRNGSEIVQTADLDALPAA